MVFVRYREKSKIGLSEIKSNHVNMKKVFVTVGTTKFPKLIETISKKDVIEILSSLGYTLIQLQTGRDYSKVHIDPTFTPAPKVKIENKSTIIEIEGKIKLKYDEYFEDFHEQIISSDLVISHAGAGSCLDVLRLQKPLIIVVNEDLMNNHQLELAEQLQNDGYVYYCVCDTLLDIVMKDISLLKRYPMPEKSLFPNYLNKCMGFTD